MLFNLSSMALCAFSASKASVEVSASADVADSLVYIELVQMA